MKGRILVTARTFRQLGGPHQEILRRAGYELVSSPLDRPLQADELADLVGGVDAIILGLDSLTAAVLERADRLKVVARYGVGLDNVDLEAATARGIVVTTTPGANSVAVAELTLTFALALARGLTFHDRAVRAGRWERRPGFELQATTLGIVGLGAIGREVAARGLALGMRLVCTDPVPPPLELVRHLEIERLSLEALLRSSDVVSLHTPLTSETRGMIGAAELAQMKPGAVLINTARGGLVDEAALYQALRAGRLGGAALDVFDREPPGRSPLLELDNFLATPHIGSTTLQSAARMGLMAAENALAVLEGRRPEAVANPEVFADRRRPP
jgi:D-3-phosphoglycerate dehydrogenase